MWENPKILLFLLRELGILQTLQLYEIPRGIIGPGKANIALDDHLQKGGVDVLTFVSSMGDFGASSSPTFGTSSSSFGTSTVVDKECADVLACWNEDGTRMVSSLSKMVKAITGCYFLVCLLVLLKAQGSHVDLTRVYTAVAKGAACNVVYIYTYVLQCVLTGVLRRTTSIRELEKESTTDFYYWNRILVRYCDGSSFTGDVEQVDPVYHVHFRGARVFDAIMEDLLERGMKNASNALLTGCSAGGLASILHCDKFRALLPTKARVKCMSDGGFFLYAKDFFGGYHFETHTFDEVVSVHGSAKSLPQSCTSTLKPGLLRNVFALTYLPDGHSWVKCQYNVSYCSSCQIKKLQGLRSEFLQTILNRLDYHSSRGLFINSCYAHCQTLFGRKWQGTNVKLNDKTISDAVGDWLYDKGVVQLVDYKNDMPHLLKIWAVLIKGLIGWWASQHTHNGQIVKNLGWSNNRLIGWWASQYTHNGQMCN
ncbi:hypothetical protein LguiA_022349 [Lonicera macranthoides]